MKLQVIHSTRYEYSRPVRESHNEARLHPTSLDGQVLHSFLLKVIPATRLRHYEDFFLNYVHFFDIPDAHDFLTVESVSVVSTVQNLVVPETGVIPMGLLRACSRMEECYDFLHSSVYVSVTPEVWRLGLDICQGIDDVWGCAVAIMQFIHQNFRYVPASTTVHTHMSEVLEGRAGVCQDFAHVMIGMCRALKIPARYVSGYLYNGPTETLTGAQASHAWCEVYIPGFGWHGLDPTNNCQVDEHHVKIAVGRDYADVVPLKGSYCGTSEMEMKVSVEVTRVEEDC